MIEIKNLSKLYSSKNGVDCLALDNLSFVLPNSGMVFITGKSGSGKSTFLNILGGLDSATSGSITIDGNEITSFNESDLENYRNTYLGFIFQEFFLIDSLTVFENVKLALDLLGLNDDSKVYKTIERVGLKGFENKYPRQLSGGEKQRVAIARAIVKEPKLLLADELTGNLDDENSKIVLDILQELSKELLVIVVSHNNDDANYYATRKIELSDGKIINDVERTYSIDTPLVTDKYINMPYHRKLTNDEVNQVNTLLPKGGYEFRQLQDGFTKTKEVSLESNDVSFVSSKLSLKNTVKYGFKFSKGNILNSITTLVLFTILLVLLFVCHVFEFTDVYYLTNEAYKVKQNDTHILVKAEFPTGSKFYIEPTHMIKVTEEEIDEFYNLGYEGNIYKIYNDVLSFDIAHMATPSENAVRKFYSLDDLPYLPYGNQTFECDVDLLKKIFNSGEDLTVLVGSLDEDYKPYSYVITDYAADCIMKHWSPYQGLSKEEVYERIVTDGYFYRNFTVKAIIDTDYETKYKDVLDLCYEIDKETDENIKKALTIELENLPLTNDYLEEITSYYSSAYYINQEVSFYDGYFHDDNPTLGKRIRFKNIFVSEENKLIKSGIYDFISGDVDVNKGEIKVPYALYNKWFGTNCSNGNLSEFTPREITITVFSTFDKTYQNYTHQKTFVISGLISGTNTEVIHCNRDDLKEMADTVLFVQALCFDNTHSILQSYVPNSLEFKPFMCLNDVYETAYEVNEVISMVKDVFLLVIIGVSVVVIILLINYTNRTISRKKRDIGIYKAIGGKDKQFRNFFIVQLGMLLFGIIVVTTLVILIFADLINEIFVNAVAVGINMSTVKEFTIIRFEAGLLGIYYVSLIGFVFVTSLLSLRSFKKIKPLNIIRNSR